MKLGPEFTLRGWFGLCPIFLTSEPNGPTLVPRHVVLYPLMFLSEAAFGTLFLVMSVLDPTFEPAYPIKVTGSRASKIAKRPTAAPR